MFRNALYRDPGVQVDCLLLHPELGVGDGPGYIEKFPEKLEDLQKYDVVFVGDVGISENPAEGLTLEQATLLRGLVEKQASGIVFLPGPIGNIFSLTQSPLADLIPVVLDITNKSGFGGPIASKLNLTTGGRRSLLTMLGDTEEDNPDIWKSLPGFNWHAPVIKAKGGTDVLAVHADPKEATSGKMVLARVNALLHAALGDVAAEQVVWMPAHKSSEDVDRLKLGNGQPRQQHQHQQQQQQQ